MQTRDFILNVLGKEIQQMTTGENGETQHAYLGFALISQAIEVLGACFDDYDWEEQKRSESRFRKGIKKLFPKTYRVYNSPDAEIDLFNSLRCFMVHQLRPGHLIGLSERKNQVNDKNLIHLRVINGQLILIYEDFLNDFQQACLRLVDLVDQGKLQTQKVLSHNIRVPADYVK